MKGDQGALIINEQDQQQDEMKGDAVKIKLSNLSRTEHFEQLYTILIKGALYKHGYTLLCRFK